ILPALAHNGILALDIIEGSYDQEKFNTFIESLLNQMNQWPLPNLVIIMDNC
ncbi:hypothetical protein C8J56DRAFT_717751, partial [Mycena floridula]